MIIEINQTKANLQAAFEIVINGKPAYLGRAPWTGAAFSTKLYDLNEEPVFETRFQPVKEVMNMIPFKWAWSEQQSKCSLILDGRGEAKGVVNHGLKGLLNPYYNLALEGEVFKVYSISKGNKVYLLFMDESDQQIAQGEKSLTVQGNLDTYRLFLPEAYVRYEALFILFILYYDSWNYGNHGEIVAKGNVEKSWEWTFDKNNKRYDPLWLKTHFGDVPNIDSGVADGRLRKTALAVGSIIVVALFLGFAIVGIVNN